MAKTIFSAGVRVTPQWLNGSQNISFDGADEDWHYPPLTIDAIKLTGDGGFDQELVTIQTSQTVTGTKVWTNTNSFSGTLNATGQYDSWTAAPDREVYLTENPQGVATNGMVQEYFAVIDGGNIG